MSNGMPIMKDILAVFGIMVMQSKQCNLIWRIAVLELDDLLLFPFPAISSVVLFFDERLIT